VNPQLAPRTSPELLDQYQEWVHNLVQDDDTGRVEKFRKSLRYPTHSRLIYCLEGLREEIREVVEHDDETANYNRLYSLFNPDSNPPNNGDAPHTARHQKEFGDVSWYGAGALSFLRRPVSLSDAYQRAFSDQTSDAQHDVGLVETPSILTGNKLMLAAHVVSCLDHIEQGALSLYRRRPLMCMGSTEANGTRIVEGEELQNLKTLVSREDDRIASKALARAVGQFMKHSERLLPVMFGITLEDVLQQNIEKIEGRIQNGTIIGTGDDR